MKNNKTGNTHGATLQKNLSPMNVWVIAFGCIVGWGSFINSGKKFLHNSGVAGTAIAMALGALVMIIIAFSYAYMVSKYPRAGGEFTFTKMCFGKNMAFLCGWFLVVAYLTNVPMNSTAIALIVDGLDGPADIFKFGFHYSVAGFEIYFGEMLLAIGASIGYCFTCASTFVTLKKEGDGSAFSKPAAILGLIFSIAFMVLQLVPIPGLQGVHFCKESYIMLIVWSAMGAAFYIKQHKFFRTKE
jgi:amino acid transporter